MRVTLDEANAVSRLCIRTRCRTSDELVAIFQRFVRGNTLFVATLGRRRTGLEVAFVIELADGTAVMHGRSVVRESWETATNPFGLPGLLLGVRALSPASKLLFERMRAGHRGRSDIGDVSTPVAAPFGNERTQIGPPLSNLGNIDPAPPAAAEEHTPCDPRAIPIVTLSRVPQGTLPLPQAVHIPPLPVAKPATSTHVVPRRLATAVMGSLSPPEPSAPAKVVSTETPSTTITERSPTVPPVAAPAKDEGESFEVVTALAPIVKDVGADSANEERDRSDEEVTSRCPVVRDEAITRDIAAERPTTVDPPAPEEPKAAAVDTPASEEAEVDTPESADLAAAAVRPKRRWRAVLWGVVGAAGLVSLTVAAMTMIQPLRGTPSAPTTQPCTAAPATARSMLQIDGKTYVIDVVMTPATSPAVAAQ